MLADIENLLVLQDRDRKIFDLKNELVRSKVERESLIQKADDSEKVMASAKEKANHIESERKDLENQVESLKTRIEKYSIQQFETKKNEEYKALENEIANCKKQIVEIEDSELELMEAFESAQSELADAKKQASDLRQTAEEQIRQLDEREKNMQAQLSDSEGSREAISRDVSDGALLKYERLRQKKGPVTVVGIDRGICAGCHMKVTTSAIAECKRDTEIVQCPNCARIIYYTRDMVLED